MLCAALLASVGWYLRWASNPVSKVLSPFDGDLLKDLPEFDDDYRNKMLWGTYRAGVYFGTRTRLPQSLLTGLAWFEPSSFESVHKMRHLAQQSDGLAQYGWKRHDGVNFGVQDILDGNVTITTSWVRCQPRRVNGFR